MMAMGEDTLLSLCRQSSKHSQYQAIASPLKECVPAVALQAPAHFERERLEYILRHVPCAGVSVADIGGNTGYFTLEFIDRGANSVLFSEGNRTHCAFVRKAVSVLGWQDRVEIHCHYLQFGADLSLIDADICLLLNVLHHVGDDYGDAAHYVESAKRSILHSVSRMAEHATHLVFQLGFNWKGNINLPLFATGTKREVIDFVESGTRDNWVMQSVGIAEATNAGVAYRDLSSRNIQRQDCLGEFLNRPLFILVSKSASNDSRVTPRSE